MKIKYIAIFFLPLLMACHKFLNVTPQGIVIPSTTSEYEGLLNSPTLVQTFSPELLSMTDDNFIYGNQASTATTDNAYYWREYINAESQNSPAVWGNLYTCIYYTNVIINGGVLTATDSSSVAKKQQILGEALVMRSYCYLDLLTVFAKAYSASTAATDPGLPLMTSLDVGDKTPARSSVQATLDTMVNNVLQAINYLPATNINKYRVTVYAAYGLLSRIYLYMADYADAKKYAELALTATHSTLNYNDYTASTLPTSASNPEVLWQRTSSNYTIPFQVLYSGDLESYYDSTIYYTGNPDLRYQYLSEAYSVGISRTDPNGVYANFGITFPEMDLTRAEVFARTGDADSAMVIVNTLRQNRIATASYAALTAGTADSALTLVLAERRRELAFGGLRWFDMKRLDQDGRMPTVYRIIPATAATATTAATAAYVIDSLPPHGVRYTFQIPSRVLQFNPNMVKND